MKAFPDMPSASQLRTDEDLSERLLKLEQDVEGERETEFKKASSASTQRIRTRKIRIKAFIDALGV
jgi:hypothetical protein